MQEEMRRGQRQAALVTGDIVFAYAQHKEAQDGSFAPLDQYGLTASSSFVASGGVVVQASTWRPRSPGVGREMQPVVLRAAVDGVGSETEPIQLLPDGVPITESCLLFLEAAQSVTGVSAPLFLTPRPSAILALWTDPVRATSRSFFLSASGALSRSSAVTFRATDGAQTLQSGSPVSLLSRFGRFRLCREDGALRPGVSESFRLEVGFVDSDFSFVFRRYAPLYTAGPDGCEFTRSVDAAQQPVFCALNGKDCLDSTGRRVFWDVQACESYSDTDPDNEGERKDGQGRILPL